MLNTVDTWWSLSPGQKLSFPNATLVRASEDIGEELITHEERETRFKANDYRISHIITLLKRGTNKDRETFAARLISDIRAEIEVDALTFLASTDLIDSCPEEDIQNSCDSSFTVLCP